jgi:hypothetical protein
MKRDIAIDEIRQVRHRISERYGHNTRLLLKHYKELEKRFESRLVKETPGEFTLARQPLSEQ